MEIYVFDINLNHLGIIDDFIELKTEYHYTKMSYLYLSVEVNKDNVDLLQKGRILIKSSDFSRGYLILKREYDDNNSSYLEVSAPSLNILLHRRIVSGQQVYEGNLENIIKSFVDKNAINTDLNRVIPGLKIDKENKCNLSDGIETASNVHLDGLTYDLCNKFDCSWDVLVDLKDKSYIFSTWKGLDKSTQQSENQHVIFSKDFDNVLRQNYIEDDSDYFSTAIVSGEDEGLTTRYVVVNDDLSGFDRYEIYCDAKEIKKTYRDDNDKEITLSDVEYNKLLSSEGEKILSSYQKITTFDSEIDLYSNNEFGVDYFLGDKVSIKNEDLGIILHTRIVSVNETINRQGTNLQISFGENIPTLVEKIKRKVR